MALDRVRDPGNLGTIIRTADAAGIAGVALVGASCDAFALEAVRATMGSIFHVPLARTERGRADRAGEAARRAPRRHAPLRRDARLPRGRLSPPLILLMGNEQQGLTEKLAAACDALVRIPDARGGGFAQPRGLDGADDLRGAAAAALS